MLHPKLYKRDSQGRVRYWQLEDDGAGQFRSYAGLIDGKANISEWTQAEVTNAGRANERSAVEQAAAEIASLYQKKRDNHYVDSIEATKEERGWFEVMLAESDDDYGDRVDYSRGVMVQPKLDGLRGPTKIDGVFSRKGKEFLTVRWISEEVLAPLFEAHPDIVLDGELYNHKFHDDFNEICSLIKRKKPTQADIDATRGLVQLWVYDCFFPDEPELDFEARYNKIVALLKEFNIPEDVIVRTPTYPVKSKAEADAKMEEFLNDNFEGMMKRLLRQSYEHKRVKHLLKCKEFVTEEYTIVEVLPGNGNWRNAAKKLRVRHNDGTERIFGSGIKGKKKDLEKVLKEKDEYIGGDATIQRIKQLTPDGIPRFPTAVKLYKGKRDD